MTSTMRALLAAAALLHTGCGSAQKPEEIDPELESYVLEAVPGDLEHDLLIDYEGKVQLVGYKLQPTGVVAPGQRFTLTMYWKAAAPLGPGWRLFTHILDGDGRQLSNPDNVGPLRKLVPGARGESQALPPSAWQPGRVYVDTQDLEMPKIETPEATVTVGIWRDRYRLQILGAGSDRQSRGIVVRIPTGFVEKPAEKSKIAMPKGDVLGGGAVRRVAPAPPR